MKNKEIAVENVFNKERYICSSMKDTTTIDGVVFLKVKKLGNNSQFLMRFDSLRKVSK